MFAKLGAYLDQQPVRAPVRCVLASGEEFVVIPAKDYTVLTGIDTATLPAVDIFDTLTKADEQPTDEQSAIEEDNGGRASALAQIPLEDEIRIDSLPL